MTEILKQLKLSGWGEEQKLELEANIDFLLSNEIKEFAPELHKLIAKSIPSLIALHHIAIQNITTEEFSDKEGNAIFYKDDISLSKAFGKASIDKVQKNMGLYAYLGMINKMSPADVPEYQYSNKHCVYSIPSYTYHVRDYAEQKAIEMACGKITGTQYI